jgi:hypothetical protein
MKMAMIKRSAIKKENVQDIKVSDVRNENVKQGEDCCNGKCKCDSKNTDR